MADPLPMVDNTRRNHRCSVCDTLAPWSASWEWYGSEADVDDGRPILKTCSDVCREAVSAQGGPQKVHRRLQRAG